MKYSYIICELTTNANLYVVGASKIKLIQYGVTDNYVGKWEFDTEAEAEKAIVDNWPKSGLQFTIIKTLKP